MQLICPSCSALYHLAADNWPMRSGADDLPEPKPTRARCKACGHVWLACPEPCEPVIALDDPMVQATHTADTAADGDARDAEQKRKRWPGLVAAAALLAMAGWAGALSGYWRPQAFGLPPAAVPDVGSTMAAMAGMGLPVDDMRLSDMRLPELALSSVRIPVAAPPPLRVDADAVRRPIPGGGLVWEVRGAVTNPGSVSQPVPPLEVVMTAADGREVGRWIVRAETERLPPGGSIAFATSAINPPSDAHMLAVRLRPASVARL